MGSSVEEGRNGDCNNETQRKMKTYLLVIFSSSLLVSVVGVFVLGWWIYKYHPANRELWMVPFGLILFLTPLIVGFSLMISDPSASKKEEEEVPDLKR